MAVEDMQGWDPINFRIDPVRKQRLKEIARENHRDLTGQMRFLVDQCLADNPVKKPRKAKPINEAT